MNALRKLNMLIANAVATPQSAAVVALLARALMAWIFLASGYGKIGAYAGTQQYMEAMGVPGALLPLVIITEVGGGLAILLGFQTRLAALGLAIFSIIAGFIFHTADDPNQQIHFLKNMAMAGGLLAFFLHGAGPMSLDAEQRQS